MSDYDKMKKSEEYDEEGVRDYDEENVVKKSSKDKYFEFYDDIKQTPKDDW